MFIIPEINCPQGFEDQMFFSREREKGLYFGFPHVQLDPNDENIFWSQILNESLNEYSDSEVDLKELDFKIYSKVHLMLKEEKIDLYSAIKYFWNRLVYYKSLVAEDELSSNFNRMKIDKIEINVSDGNFIIEPPLIILPDVIQKVPLLLVPNLVCFLREHFLRRNRYRNYNLMFRNNFKELLNYPYPRIRIPKKQNAPRRVKKKKLTEEYRYRPESVKGDDFVSARMIMEMVKQLNPSQKKKALKFLEQL